VEFASVLASPAHCKHGGRQEQAHLQGQERWQKENVSNPALSVGVHVLCHCIECRIVGTFLWSGVFSNSSGRHKSLLDSREGFLVVSRFLGLALGLEIGKG
jgi:hypothetical protein